MRSPHARFRIVAALVVLGALLGAACGSSSSKPSAGNSTTTTAAATGGSSGQSTTTASGSSAHGSLTVTGSLSLNLNFATGTHGRCNAPAAGATGNTTGTLDFTDGTTYYALQFTLAKGTSTFPADAEKNFVALYASTDSTKEWSIGSNVTKAEAGTVTFTGTGGTVDVDMAPDPPNPNPALKPIHVRGTFECQ